MRDVLALDIETTGLDPLKDRVVSAALHGSIGSYFVHDKDEIWTLWALSNRDFGRLALVTWNGDEFDLPFLHTRASIHSVHMGGLELMRLGQQKGKYGNPLWRATWGGAPCVDIAPWYRDFARRNGIRWGLKPVAEALGLHPVTLPAGTVIADLDPEQLEEYNRSDARVAYELFLMGGDDVARRTSFSSTLGGGA